MRGRLRALGYPRSGAQAKRAPGLSVANPNSSSTAILPARRVVRRAYVEAAATMVEMASSVPMAPMPMSAMSAMSAMPTTAVPAAVTTTMPTAVPALAGGQVRH
jgi:hypothetical protein